MTAEFFVREAQEKDFDNIAKVEAKIIIKQVLEGELPYCDLGLSDNSHTEVIFLERHLIPKRSEKLQTEADDPNRKTFIALDSNENIVGTISVRFKPQGNQATIYSFYIQEENRGTLAALNLLRACFQEVETYEKNSGNKLNSIRTNRYKISEDKRLFLNPLMNMLNKIKAGTVTAESFDWKGFTCTSFDFDRDDAFELLDELGEKLSRFI